MTITAKFASTCPTCNARIAAGEQVEWSKGSPARHVACTQAPVAPAPAGVPSRDEAIARLVELNVAKWGEAERGPSARSYAKQSHGALLNTLAHWDLDNIDKALVKAASKLMTRRDRAGYRDAGSDD